MRAVRLLVAGCWLLVGMASTGELAFAQQTGQMPTELEGAGIDEQLGTVIPSDVIFKNEQGQDVALSNFLDGERPVLLALVYHECPMLCNMVLHGLTKALAQMDWVPGEEFEVLAVSFNPRETPDVAREEKEMIVQVLGKPAASAGMHFLTGSEASITALTDAVGFTYRWIEDKEEYAHPSGLIFLSGDGMVSRYLYGIDYKPRDLRSALVEASNGNVGSTLDRVILYCFQYDPNANSYVPHALNLMKVGGVLTMILLGGLLVVFWRRESHRSNEQVSA